MKPKQTIKKEYKIIGMDCASCASLIELDLEEAGIKATCNFAKAKLEVDFDPQETSVKKIKEIVETSGYKLIS